MSISSTVRRAGPFAGSGTVAAFPFPFKVFQPSDLLVVTVAVATGVQSTLVLNSDYSVALNPNQDANPGGTITLANGSLPTGYSLVIASAVPELQGVDLTNQGGFYPEVVSAEFDYLTILIQQLSEQLGRTLEFPITDPAGITTQLPPVAQRAGMYLSFDDNGNPVAVIAAPSQSTPQTLSFGYLEATSTAGQTVFTTPPYTPGANNLFVTAGGVLLAVGVDYTETSPTSITVNVPAAAGDIYTFRSIVASGFSGGGAATPNVLVVPYAASITLNAGLANGFYISGMTGNLTIAGVWGLAPGQPIAMFYQQDATGGRTVTFPAIMVGAAQPDPTPNAVSVQIFAFDAVTGKLRASGPLFSANGAFFAQGINTLGAVGAASGVFSGAVAAASLTASGALTAATASVGSIAAALAAVSGLLTAGSATVAGLLTAGSLTLAAPGTPGQVLTNVGGVFVPRSVGGTRVDTANGSYITLPDGTLMQWGVKASAAGGNDSTVAITFPIPFPTAVQSIQTTLGGLGSTGGKNKTVGVIGGTTTLAGFSAGMAAMVYIGGSGGNFTGSETVEWFAIGY